MARGRERERLSSKLRPPAQRADVPRRCIIIPQCPIHTHLRESRKPTLKAWADGTKMLR